MNTMAIATWVGYPRGYTTGRNRPVQYVVIHYTAGSEGPTSAEAGAAYDKTRTDGTSTHCFADSNSVVREVPDTDRAHHARFHGNEIGLGLELCGTAQTRAQWLDAASLPTLRLGAKQTAEWCRDHGLPVRRLSVAQTRAAYYAAPGYRPFGIVGHVDCTEAYPEDSGTHTDPGPEFPWDVFLAMVAEELAPIGDDDVLSDPQNNALAEDWAMAIALRDGVSAPAAGNHPGGTTWAVTVLNEIKAAVTSPVPVTVDADAVAAALAGNAAFLAAVAKAVNDDASKRGAE
jgi:hypothetical protein